jgi:hypothetical protein
MIYNFLCICSRPALFAILEGYLAGSVELSNTIHRPQVVRKIEIYLSGLPAFYRWAFVGLFLSVRLSGFGWLSVSKRAAILDQLSDSRIAALRLLGQGLKFLFLPQIYSEQSAFELVGYDAAFVRRQKGVC